MFSMKVEKVRRKKKKLFQLMIKNNQHRKQRVSLKKSMISKIENKSVCCQNSSIFNRHFVCFFLAEEESAQSVNKEELTPNIPNFAQYLIIGGGTAAMSAFKSIRAHDPTSKVCLINIRLESFEFFLSFVLRCWS